MQPIPSPVAPKNASITMKELLAKTKIYLPQEGDVLEGTVMSTSRTQVVVDLGTLGTGIIYPREFYEQEEKQSELKPGDKVQTVLLDIENSAGYRELSLKQAHTSTAWTELEEMLKNGTVIKKMPTNINKGGLLFTVQGIQAFMPLSQLSPEHYPNVENGDTTKIVQALQKMRTAEFTMKVISVSENENKLIVSEKAAQISHKEQDFEQYSVGDVVDVEIADVTDFGAFVKFDGIEGLIHTSEIDWGYIKNPKETLKIGETVKAKIIKKEGNKLALSLKALKEDPWNKIKEKYEAGQTIEGTIEQINIHGVFVTIEPSIVALAPLNEFGSKNPKEMLEVGQVHSFAIVEFDPKEHKMILTPA